MKTKNDTLKAEEMVGNIVTTNVDRFFFKEDFQGHAEFKLAQMAEMQAFTLAAIREAKKLNKDGGKGHGMQAKM